MPLQIPDQSYLLNQGQPSMTDTMNKWLQLAQGGVNIQRSQTALSQEQLNLSKSTQTLNDEVNRVHADTQKAMIEAQNSQYGQNMQILGDIKNQFASVASSPEAQNLADLNDPTSPASAMAQANPALVQQWQKKVSSDLAFHKGYAASSLKGTTIDPSVIDSTLSPFPLI